MSTDRYRIDGHKLAYHPGRVSRWLDKENIYPVYVEISPAGACNHRCVFCSVDFMGFQNRFLDTGLLKERLKEMSRLRVKSVMYAGEGEPFLHKDMAEIIIHTKKMGIDVALTTNGVLMKPEIIDTILGVTEWIKVSCNAGTPEGYSKIHRAKAADFNMVIRNLEYAVELKRQKGYACALGLQFLLIPDNADEVEALARIAKKMGIDYFVVKPYTHHHLNSHGFDIEYGTCSDIAKRLAELNDESFSVIFRIRAMRKWDEKSRPYDRCLALPFWAYIDAGGNVWGCGAHLQEEAFNYGDINTSAFQQIWEGDKRMNSLEWVEDGLDMASCKLNCRMDEINRYLWELKNPVEHVNFI